MVGRGRDEPKRGSLTFRYQVRQKPKYQNEDPEKDDEGQV